MRATASPTRQTLLVALAGLASLGLVAGCTTPTPGATATATPSPTEEPFFVDLADFPRMDGSTATQPLGLAFKEGFTGTNLDADDVPFSKTHEAYLNLVAGDTDIILVTSPSDDELAAAAQAGVELEVVPVVNEGFVFITNANNTVTDLTVDQLRDIYSGKTTDWNQVGGPKGRITAFQRPENSGSQTGMLDLVMQGTPMVSAPQRQIQTMDAIIDAVAEFTGSAGALGYSYYYYVTAMYGPLATGQQQDGIQLLSVDGIFPTPQTIKDRTYPLTSAYYVVIRADEPKGSVVRRLAQAMLSGQGQAIAQQAGYVPVGDVADLVAPLPYTPPSTTSQYAASSLEDTWRRYPLTLTHSVQDGVDRLTIDGLTDESVEQSINALFAKAQDDYRATHPGFRGGICASSTCWADGTWWDTGSASQKATVHVAGNVLSVYEYVVDPQDRYDTSDHGAVVNVRLDTGEAFTFTDLFTDGAPVEGILADAYRETFAYDDQNINGSRIPTTTLHYPADIETRVIDLISDFRKSDPEFVLCEYAEPGAGVIVSFGNYRLTILFDQYWKSVAVERFSTDNDDALYTGRPRTATVFHLP